VKAQGSTETFVPANTLQASFSTGSIDDIAPVIDFQSDTHNAQLKWLDISWTQNVRTEVSCTILDFQAHRLAVFQQRDDDQPPFHTTSVIVPKSWLIKPVDIFCITQGAAPVILPVRSLVKLDLAISTGTIAGLHLTADAKERKRIANLRKLDASLGDVEREP